MDAIKDHIAEQLLFRRRALVLGVAMLCCIGALVGRLFQLQHLQFDRYATASNSNRIQVEPVASVRGLIVDRNGVVIADNRAAFSLQVTPERVGDLESSLRGLQRILAIGDDDIAAFREQVAHQRGFQRAALRSYMSEEEAAVFAVNRHRFPGVDLQGELVRNYPMADLTAHVVGYVGRIGAEDQREIDPNRYRATLFVGKAGVERAQERRLHGAEGYQEVEVDAHGRSLRILNRRDPVPGEPLTLNLDIELQRTATEALAGQRGAVVAIEPATGAVLALVSQPAFDPNLFVTGLNRAAYQELIGGGRPLFNRALQGQYPPGSTIKPFVALAGLHDGKIAATSGEYCSGAFQLPNRQHKYRCWKRHGHGYLAVSDAIKQSCDVFFYRLAVALGPQRLHDHLAAFGLGSRTGIDIGGESAGLVPSPDWKRAVYNTAWYPGETVISGIGQGYHLVTPVQLALATAVIANRGNVVPPEVVRLSVDAGGPRRHFDRSSAHWDLVVAAMEAVMQSPGGTAYRVGLDAPYRMAGKTGTAQVYQLAQGDAKAKRPVDERLQDHALFIAFAPVESPRIAVAVVVENGGAGSSVAGPIARRVLDRYLVAGGR